MSPGDLIALGFQGILILRLLQKQEIPPIPSPLADVTYEGMMGPRRPLLRVTPSLDVPGTSLLSQTSASQTAVSCIACTKHHLAGVAAMLNEATRFTRSGTPISDPEIQERLAIAEEEIAAWERKDVTPAQIAASPPEERGLILATVEKVRGLRHFIDSSRLGMGKGTPEDLEKAAAMASQIRQEFRGHLVEMGQEHTETEIPKPPGNPGHENPGHENPGPANPRGATPPTLREMILAKTYPGAPEGIRLTEFPTQAYNRPEKFALYSTSTSTYYGKPWDTFEEAVAAANRENIRMHGNEPLPTPTAPQAARVTKPQTFEQNIRAQIKERETKWFKSGNDEIQIERLKATLAADPNRWQVGQGVGWKVGRGQVNRGYRIESMIPETKEAIIRPVGDIGQLADYTGQAEQVDIIDLIRDKKYDALPEELKTNPGHENPGSKDPWQMTRDEYLSQVPLSEGARAVVSPIPEGISDSMAQRLREMQLSKRYVYDREIEGFTAKHRGEVFDAVSKGQPVPPKVLADYPDLAARVAAAQPTPEGVIPERSPVEPSLMVETHPEHPGHTPQG